MSLISDIWRTTFPKNLRYNRQCIVFHAQLESLVKRFKFKKYIPAREILDLVNSYQRCPYRFMELPVLRTVLLVRLVNGYRVARRNPSWLTSQAAIQEHARIIEWVRLNLQQKYVERERFQREVMEEFQVATMYHRVFNFCMLIVATLIVLIIAGEQADWTVFCYLRWFKRFTRPEIIGWFNTMVEQHAIAQYTEAFKDKIPAPCVKSGVDGHYYVQVVEMISPKRDRVVVFIPCPTVGPKEFYQRVGKLAAACDAVMLEGVPLENLHVLPPSAYFPLKEDLFPALKLHHRFWPILDKRRAPPQLLAGGVKATRMRMFREAFVPFTMKVLYRPFFFGDERNLARIGWGRIKEALDDPTLRTIAVPWTVRQIANLESSLLRQKWSMRIRERIRWLKTEDVGNAFCDYFGIPSEESQEEEGQEEEGHSTATSLPSRAN